MKRSRAPSLWADEAPPPAWPSLEGDVRCEVLVIGAGLAGLAVAGELEARGAAVCVVDAASPGAGASARNAGFVLVAHPWEYPELRAGIGREAAREVIALARRTHARIEREHADEVQHRRCGSLMLTIAGDDEEARALERASVVLREDGVESEWVAPPAALAGFGRALRIPEDGEVHPGALVARLAARVRRGVIARIDALDPTARVARAGAHRIAFERVVIATNAWARELVPELDTIVTPQRAQVLVTAPVAPALDVPCYATYGYDYFRQRRDGSLILGGRRHFHRADEASDDAVITGAVQASLEAFLHAHLPFARAPIVRRWAGIMGFSRDALPLVGPLPRAPDTVSLIAGFTGHGLGLAIACAERLARALDGDPSAVPRVLDPARFPTILGAP